MSPKTVDLVVARYDEDLAWLQHVPPTVTRIFVYNKGHGPHAERRGRRRTRVAGCAVPQGLSQEVTVIDLPNRGREADTYLSHIEANYDAAAFADLTIFSQADPFVHSPDFLFMLAHAGSFRAPVQPLTDRWIDGSGFPPDSILANFRSTCVRGDADQLQLRACAHPISSHTLDNLRFYDTGVVNTRNLCGEAWGLGLGAGANIARDAFTRCGAHAAASRCSDVIHMCVGAIFAVTADALLANPKCAYEGLRSMCLSHGIGPYLLERLWLPLFGFVPQGDEVIQHVRTQGDEVIQRKLANHLETN